MDELLAALADPELSRECATYAWHMRVVLAHLRDLGMDFDQAWSRALMSLPRPETGVSKALRQEWGELLHSQRALWERAYYKIPRPMLGAAPELAGELAA